MKRGQSSSKVQGHEEDKETYCGCNLVLSQKVRYPLKETAVVVFFEFLQSRLDQYIAGGVFRYGERLCNFVITSVKFCHADIAIFVLVAQEPDSFIFFLGQTGNGLVGVFGGECGDFGGANLSAVVGVKFVEVILVPVKEQSIDKPNENKTQRV